LDAFKIHLLADFAQPPAQKQSQCLYRLKILRRLAPALWRGEFLRDKNYPPPERLLQAIWRHSGLQRDQLRTADGQAVRICIPVL